MKIFNFYLIRYAKAASVVAKGSRLNGRPMEKEAVLQMLREGSEQHQHENKVFTFPPKKCSKIKFKILQDSIVEETDISMLDVIKVCKNIQYILLPKLLLFF